MCLEYFIGQIGKAAKIIDLKGDVVRAIDVLSDLLVDERIRKVPVAQVEVHAFLADIYSSLGNDLAKRNHIVKAKSVQLSEEELDLVVACMSRLDEL